MFKFYCYINKNLQFNFILNLNHIIIIINFIFLVNYLSIKINNLKLIDSVDRLNIISFFFKVLNIYFLFNILNKGFIITKYFYYNKYFNFIFNLSFKIYNLKFTIIILIILIQVANFNSINLITIYHY